MFQQRIVANRKVGQVCVAVAFGAVANLQVGQFRTMAKINIPRVKSTNVANALYQAGIVNINLGIVHGCNRALNRVGLAALTTHFYRVGAIQNTHIGICIRADMKRTVRLHTCPVGRGIAADRHIISRAGRTAVLARNILFLVLLVLTALVAFVAVHHRQVIGRSIVFIGAEIFAPHVHDPKLFGLHILVRLNLAQNTVCTPGQSALTVQVHLLQVVRKKISYLAPQLAVCRVKHALGANGVGVLIAVSQCQSALIVVALAGIVIIIHAKIPMDQIFCVGEHILGAVIHHCVALSEQIIEQYTVLDEVVLKVGLKLFVICIYYPGQQALPGILCLLCFFLGTLFANIAELKAVVAVPGFLAQIITQKAGLGIGVVVNLNNNFLVVFGVHTLGVIVLLAVANITAGVKMPLAILKHRCVLHVRLLNKYHARVKRHRVAHLRVLFLCLTGIRIKRVVFICNAGIVCVFRACNVYLDIEIFLRDTILCQGIGAAGAVVTKRKSAGTVNVNVSAALAIRIGAGTLTFMTAGRGPVILHSASVLVNLLDGGIKNLILFAGRKGRSADLDNAQVRALLGQKVSIQFAAHIGNIVAVIAFNHQLGVLGIRNKVVQDLIVRQLHAVGLHAVYLHITVRRTNRNANRVCLCKVVACIVQFHLTGDTVAP